MSPSDPPVAAPTPETPSNPVGRINGAQTMSFTPVPDHPTPETPSKEPSQSQIALDAVVCLIRRLEEANGSILGLLNRIAELEQALAGAVSHPQPDRETFEQMDARIKAEMHAEEVEEGIVSDKPTTTEPGTDDRLREQIGRVRVALLREDSQRAETLFRAASGLCIAAATHLREEEQRRGAHPVVSPRTET